MQILVITIGSAGDVHPFIGLGVELKRRGHQVTLFTSDYFAQDIRKAGLDFVAMFTASDFAKIMDHPDLWDPIRGFKLLYRDVFVPLIPVVYKFVAERFVPGETGVVASTLGFGARVAQDRLRVPTVSVHLQPAVFRSVYETPVFPGMNWLVDTPRWMKRAVFRLMDAYIDKWIAGELNAFRKTLGLPPVNRIYDRWVSSPECVLGLFPEWFGSPQPDWPPQTQLAGFPLYDAAAQNPISAELRGFLDQGEPPVIFTAGSAMKQGRWFFEAAVEACERLNIRGLLVNRFRDQIPARLPPRVIYADYAPFSAVFPLASVVVHHGGIGTTAQVLAAGVPQLVVPLSFDQPDQAARVERLGTGLAISRRDFTGRAVADRLRRILQEPAIAERARELATRMDGPRAITTACDMIEQTFRRSILSA